MDFLKMKKQETYFAEQNAEFYGPIGPFCNMLNIFKVLKILVSIV